jgi:hypothetical protein
MLNNTETTMTKTYEIHYSNGRVERDIETYEAAVNRLRAEYPDAEIGHSGDLADFGDRTLCWASEEDSVDDDGARAVASIHARE